MTFEEKIIRKVQIKKALANGDRVIYENSEGTTQFVVSKIQSDYLTVFPYGNCQIVSIRDRGCVFKNSEDGSFCAELGGLEYNGFHFTA